ncbi:MAG: uncharacterized protein V7603_1947 [Micromonosporaceae bacterium]
MTGRRQLVVPSAGGWLVASVDEPAGPAGVVVIAHDLLADRTGPARAGAMLGAALAEGGLSCLRFDFTGAGDSAGRLRRGTWKRMTEDVVRICDWAYHHLGRLPLVLVGQGIGAVPVLQATAALPACRGVLLLDSDLLQDVRYVIGDSVAIKRGQWHLPEGFFREREGLRPRAVAVAAPVPTVLAYGIHDEKAVAGAAELSGTAVRTVPLPDGHPFRAGHTAAIRSVADLAAGLFGMCRHEREVTPTA